MPLIQELTTSCPYCAESISLLIDDSVEAQEYIEDCQVCCRPMVIHMTIAEDGSVDLDVRTENE